MIRRAVYSDVPEILSMAFQFNEEYYDTPLNPEKTEAAITNFVESHVAFVSPKGFIGGMVIDAPMRDWSVLVEFAWYANDRHGIKLLDAFIAEGTSLEVDEIRMCTLDTSPPSALKLLSRKGFNPIETSHRLIPNRS